MLTRFARRAFLLHKTCLKSGAVVQKVCLQCSTRGFAGSKFVASGGVKDDGPKFGKDDEEDEPRVIGENDNEEYSAEEEEEILEMLEAEEEEEKRYAEPKFLVDHDEHLDMDEVSALKFALLPDEMKLEIYQKYVSDPKKFSVSNLANEYGALPERIRGVLYLIEKRHEKFRSLGFEIGEDGHAVIPTHWQKVHDLKKENPEMSLADLAAATGIDDVTEEEVKNILASMTEHSWRMDNYNDGEEHAQEIREYYEEDGVDTRFEDDLSGRTSKMEENYFPALLGDEAFEREKRKLLKRLTQETKAVQIRDFKYYVSKHSESPAKVLNSEGIEELSTTETEVMKVEDIVPPKHDHSKVKIFSRTKIAFRDLSFMNYKGKSASITEEKPEITLATFERDAQGRLKTPAPDTRRRKNVASFAAPPATMVLSRGGV